MPFAMPSHNWARPINRLAGRIINRARERTYPVRETYIPRPDGNGDVLEAEVNSVSNEYRAGIGRRSAEEGFEILDRLMNAQGAFNRFRRLMVPFQSQNREFGDLTRAEYNGHENYRRFEGGGEAAAGGGGVRRAARRVGEIGGALGGLLHGAAGRGARDMFGGIAGAFRRRGGGELELEDLGGGGGGPGAPGGGGPPPPIPLEDDQIPHRGIAHRLMRQGIGHAKEIKGDLSAMKGMGDVVKSGAEVGSGISKLASGDGKGSTAGNIIGGALGGLVAGLGTYAAYRGLSTPEQRSALRAENNFHDEADLQDRRRRMNQEAQDAIVRI